MIDDFAPQPYPLECSSDGDTWDLVVGWRLTEGGLVPVVVGSPGGPVALLPTQELRYRLADTRPVAPRPTASAAARVEPAAAPPRRERGA